MRLFYTNPDPWIHSCMYLPPRCREWTCPPYPAAVASCPSACSGRWWWCCWCYGCPWPMSRVYPFSLSSSVLYTLRLVSKVLPNETDNWETTEKLEREILPHSHWSSCRIYVFLIGQCPISPAEAVKNCWTYCCNYKLINTLLYSSVRVDLKIVCHHLFKSLNWTAICTIENI